MENRNLKGIGLVATVAILTSINTVSAADLTIDPVVAVDPVIDPIIVLPELFDNKTMPGNACEAMYGSQSGVLNHYTWGLYNTANGYVRVSCPIVRDNTSNGNGTWSANVYGFNPGGNFACSLYSYSTHGALQQVASANTAAAGNITLSLDVNNSSFNGFYTIYCNLPANARLYSYRWAEPLRTDRNN